MRRLELAVFVAGAASIVLALAAIDWRMGLLVTGVFLVISVIDLPRTRA